MALPETFTQFARTAAEQLRWKKARPLVEDELLTHLCDQRDALMAGGMDETAATAESLRLTGDPYEIGTELDRVHRPKTPKLLFALAALIDRQIKGIGAGDIWDDFLRLGMLLSGVVASA